MTVGTRDESEFTMRYRVCIKFINRGLTCVLLFLVLLVTLVVVQLFLYYDSFHANSLHREVQTAWPHFGHHLGDGSSQNTWVREHSLRTRHLADVSKFLDVKYNKLWKYHKRGISLREKFDCRKLFENNAVEQQKVIHFHNQNDNNYSVTDSETAKEITTDCDAFKAVRGYRLDQGSSEEKEFRIAYVILVHKDFEHLERLLRTIYMPQHSYCIHVDRKAPESLKEAVNNLAKCFNNVIVASRPYAIIYAHISRLLADMVCMKDLLQKDKSWRYLINYAATEFPLRTNLEIVKILQLFHGLNDIHEQFQRRVEDRFKREYEVLDGKMKHTFKPLPLPPHNLTIIKGQAYNTFSRPFLEWVFTDKTARDLLEWSNKTYSPDEHYWATLNNLFHNSFLNSPGGFKGHPDKKGYLTRFISWQYSNPRFKCHGRTFHSICIFSALDLPVLLTEMHIAANKFDLTFDPIAYSCMEELIENKTSAQLPINLQDYSRLYFIRFNGTK